MRLVLIGLLTICFSSSTWAQTCGIRGCTMPQCNPGVYKRYERVRVQKRTKIQPSVVPIKQETKTEVQIEASRTPQRGIELFIQKFKPSKNDIILDLGCGDGTFLIEVAQKTGCRGIGIEINKRIAQRAYNRVQRLENLRNRVKIFVGNAITTNRALYWSATYAYVYQAPEVMVELIPVLPPEAVCISYEHPWPNRRQKRIVVEDQTYYLLLRD